MNLKCFYALYAIAGLISTSNMAFAEAPHWTHLDQSEWGMLEDTSQQTVPMMYPYAECSIGKHQSPVELGGEQDSRPIDTLKVHYTNDKADFFNSGHAVQVNTSSNYRGTLKIGNDEYPLIQYHFHAPSEHVINGVTYPAEMHLVHVRDDGRVAVLAVLIKEGKYNEIFQTILNNSPAPSEHNANTGITINPRSLLPHDLKHFYTYAGSLTTPPCSEGVSWYILAKPLTISADQLSQLEGFYVNNNRDTQAMNGRTITGKTTQ